MDSCVSLSRPVSPPPPPSQPLSSPLPPGNMGRGGQALVLIFLAVASAAEQDKKDRNGLVLEGCWIRAIEVHACKETIFRVCVMYPRTCTLRLTP